MFLFFDKSMFEEKMVPTVTIPNVYCMEFTTSFSSHKSLFVASGETKLSETQSSFNKQW